MIILFSNFIKLKVKILSKKHAKPNVFCVFLLVKLTNYTKAKLFKQFDFSDYRKFFFLVSYNIDNTNDS